jgi:hypothetical protein
MSNTNNNNTNKPSNATEAGAAHDRRYPGRQPATSFRPHTSNGPV